MWGKYNHLYPHNLATVPTKHGVNVEYLLMLGDRILVLTHACTVRPEKLLVKLVTVEVDGEEVAVPRA